jgi:hypothetical protein
VGVAAVPVNAGVVAVGVGAVSVSVEETGVDEGVAVGSKVRKGGKLTTAPGVR